MTILQLKYWKLLQETGMVIGTTFAPFFVCIYGSGWEQVSGYKKVSANAMAQIHWCYFFIWTHRED